MPCGGGRAARAIAPAPRARPRRLGPARAACPGRRAPARSRPPRWPVRPGVASAPHRAWTAWPP
eukprot:scaffold13603_cov112-Isochrysis_galbana.AAC.10